jgi:branched-chain amino acid transport system substrate-binding protein
MPPAIRMQRVTLALLMLIVGASLSLVGGVAAAATSKAPLIVGSIDSSTGSCLPQPTNDVLNTNAAWVKYVNAHGGIAGHKIELMNFNDNCDPGQSTADAQKLIRAHALAVFDNTEEDSSWLSAVQGAGIPVICGIETGNNENCFTQTNVFPSGSTVLTGLYGNVAAAKLAGAKSYSVVYCTEVAACAEALPLFKAYSAELGLTYDNPLAASETAPNYTAQCIEFQQEKVQAVFPAGPPADKVATDCVAQGYHPIITQSAGTWLNRFVKVPALNGSTGTYGNVPWFLNDSATKVFHEVVGKLLSTALSPYNLSGAYGAALLFQTAAAKALQSSAAPTAKDITTALYSLSGTTLGGFSPPLTFTAGKPPSVNCFFIVSIKHGKFVAPEGDKTECQPPASS